ncbi:MAG: hypothetical protein WCG86_07810, partial [Actinomycetota bacterium]
MRRTTHQRDKRLIRVRRVAQSVFVVSGAATGVLVGYAANAVASHPVSHPVSDPTTSPSGSGQPL